MTDLVSIMSAGGPYVVLPESNLGKWKGYADQNAYEAIAYGADFGRIVTAAGGTALVLGTPDTLYFWPLDTGGVFVRVSCFDAADDAVLARHLERLPKKGWKGLKGELKVKGKLYAFDAATAGADIGNDALEIELPQGSYSAGHLTFKPDDGTELLLVRLTRK